MNANLNLAVIDDDDVDRLILKRALSSSRLAYRLTEYQCIDEIENLQSLNEFDCIFLDYMLRGHNGLSLLKKIRMEGVKTPVVIVTSHGNENIAVDLMKAGASDYVIKNDIGAHSISKILQNILRTNEVLREKELTEEALRKSEARLAEAQRIAKVGNWEVDLTTDTAYCSDEVHNIFESDGKPSTIESFMAVVHPDDRPLVDMRWDTCLREGKLDIDFRIVTPSQIKYVNSQGYVVYDEQKRPERIIGTTQDITARKLAEQEISKAVDLAERSLKVKEIFLATMSHEIRTPMNAILGFTRLLLDTPLTDEQKGYVDAIHFSGENLLVIINDILDLSKIRSGKMVLEKCDFDLGGLLNGVVAILNPKAREKGLRLEYDLDHRLPIVLNGDPVRLNQILTNLISNAIKFTERGEVRLTIIANNIHDNRVSIQFNVSDTGIGIPRDKQQIIFDNFVQASEDTTRKYGGTGLGLSIVKSLVELQDGKLSLASEPGRGSTFSIQLEYETAVENTISLQSAGPQNPQKNLRDVSVLVVEDNVVNQLLIRKVLEKAQCLVDIANNGSEGVARARDKKYDIILMDVQMPEMDGYEATRLIRSSFPKPASEIPIIAMTAHAFGSDAKKCIDMGVLTW
jgi:signal transduction histidine kinase/DNA-binding response OmpR family regulator